MNSITLSNESLRVDEGVSLIDQIRDAIENSSRLGRSAQVAYRYLEDLHGHPVEFQERVIESFSNGVLCQLNLGDDDSLVAALYVAAVLEARRSSDRRLTASEKVDRAMQILEDDCQADW